MIYKCGGSLEQVEFLQGRLPAREIGSAKALIFGRGWGVFAISKDTFPFEQDAELSRIGSLRDDTWDSQQPGQDKKAAALDQFMFPAYHEKVVAGMRGRNRRLK
jgi:hypothetical protein